MHGTKTKVTPSVGVTVHALAVNLRSNNIDQGTNKIKLCGRQWYESSDPWHHRSVVRDVWRCSDTQSRQVGVPDLLTCSWVYDMYCRHSSLVCLSSLQVNCCCFMIIQIYSVCTSFVCPCATYQFCVSLCHVPACWRKAFTTAFLNIVSKNPMLAAAHLTEMHGPWPMADAHSSECYIACCQLQ